MTISGEQPREPAPREPGVDTGDLEDCEFVTLSGHRYVSVHLEEGGWKSEQGFLERRQQAIPVANERRRRADEG